MTMNQINILTSDFNFRDKMNQHLKDNVFQMLIQPLFKEIEKFMNETGLNKL